MRGGIHIGLLLRRRPLQEQSLLHIHVLRNRHDLLHHRVCEHEQYRSLYASFNPRLLVRVLTNTCIDIFTTFAFGCIYGTSPLVLMWVANIICYPAEKRAVAIGLVNALGNTASIYGVFLWPEHDAPRYIPGFRYVIVLCFPG